MTPRKELIIGLKQALKEVAALEYIDLQKGQYENPKSSPAGTKYTAALIEISDIEYEDMTNKVKEGVARASVYIYTKEGWTDQFAGSPDPEEGLAEIDLQDTITEQIEGTYGQQFKPLYLKREGALPSPQPGIMAYKLEFQCNVYKKLKSRYVLN